MIKFPFPSNCIYHSTHTTYYIFQKIIIIALKNGLYVRVTIAAEEEETIKGYHRAVKKVLALVKSGHVTVAGENILANAYVWLLLSPKGHKFRFSI